MRDLDITFEETPWELTLQTLHRGDRLSAARFLTLMEGENEQAVEDALQDLEDRQIGLDVSDLPRPAGTGEAALRLRREAELAQKGDFLTALDENDPLRLYLEELTDIPACADIRVLAEECARGDASARERLLNASLSRAVELARGMTGRGVLLLDLIQEASLGLWQAIAGYTGGDFEQISDWWMNQSMAKVITLQARANGVGAKLRQAMEDYRAVDERLLVELGRNPTLEEIAEQLHMPPEEAAAVEQMLENARQMDKVAEASQPKEQEDPEDAQAVEDTAYFQMRQRIQELLAVLPEADAKLLTLRFGLEGGLPLSPEDTGRKLGLTPEEVVTKEAAALARLRTE